MCMDALIATTTSVLSALGVIFLVILAAIILLIAPRNIFSRFSFQKKVSKHISSPHYVVLFIKIPPSNQENEKAMEEFLHSLHRVIPSNTHISLEMVSSNQFLRFYIRVPRTFKNVIESQLYAQY